MKRDIYFQDDVLIAMVESWLVFGFKTLITPQDKSISWGKGIERGVLFFLIV